MPVVRTSTAKRGRNSSTASCSAADAWPTNTVTTLWRNGSACAGLRIESGLPLPKSGARKHCALLIRHPSGQCPRPVRIHVRAHCDAQRKPPWTIRVQLARTDRRHSHRHHASSDRLCRVPAVPRFRAHRWRAQGVRPWPTRRETFLSISPKFHIERWPSGHCPQVVPTRARSPISPLTSHSRARRVAICAFQRSMTAMAHGVFDSILGSTGGGGFKRHLCRVILTWSNMAHSR